ncbi:hypothetical protein J433_10602 [Corynebacterium glutamicum MT]|uniref:Polysaccharide biosynthesis protein n=1 Tax=Corynebacterium glutamicum TaxID=1718 RepID=A0AB36IB57_CORGT|nr:hypothetical protein [Corynebacterium glutamicum]EGV40928.1 hypothetical protein CgS9114_04892 [Corynebacterium glutamicum S9114]AGN18002.1 hypothetical protein C624_02065 [Corynebacterium glutamicum SCgG1]AGN21025.1 hypothetical protein C629_02065 [Corynebacterium glutamicum SCgG2]EOA64264.1 hypothetical protein J433_10602 [Corynebacterium glutamicum MT]EPP41744.1 hypothetical protein A583_01601 [Corynebacterium glutamicum Z188]
MRYLTLATIIAGLSGFVVIIIAAWALGDSSQLSEEFTAYWGLFFAGTGVLTGLTQETTRAVTAGRARGGVAGVSGLPGASVGFRPFLFSFVVAAIVLVVLGASAPLWIGQLLSELQGVGVGLLAVGLASYAIQATISGILSGCQLWKEYASLISLDTGIRMVLAVVAWLLGYQLLAFLIITVVGSISWLVIVLCFGSVRSVLGSVADVSRGVFIRQALLAMAASGATAVLITGFPTLLKFTNPSAVAGGVSMAAVSYAVILTRAPLLVPLQQFQSAIIVRFVKGTSGPLKTLAGPLAIVWAIGLVGAGFAWLVGPWILDVVLQKELFAVPGWLLAMLTLGATTTASLMVSGCAAIAFERHGIYLTGWVVATVVAVGFLLGPFDLGVAAGLALIVGPLCGLVVHMGAFVGGARKERAVAAS